MFRGMSVASNDIPATTENGQRNAFLQATVRRWYRWYEAGVMVFSFLDLFQQGGIRQAMLTKVREHGRSVSSGKAG